MTVVPFPHQHIWGWDVSSRRCVFEHELETISCYKLAIAGPSGHLLMLTDDALLRVELPSGRVRTCWPADGIDVAVLAASHDGKLLAFGRKNRTIELLDMATGKTIHTMLGHLGTPTDLQFSPDGKTLIVQDTRGDLRFWHVASGSELLTWELPAPIQEFYISPNQDWFATAVQGRLQVIDLRSDLSSR